MIIFHYFLGSRPLAWDCMRVEVVKMLLCCCISFSYISLYFFMFKFELNGIRTGKLQTRWQFLCNQTQDFLVFWWLTKIWTKVPFKWKLPQGNLFFRPFLLFKRNFQLWPFSAAIELFNLFFSSLKSLIHLILTNWFKQNWWEVFGGDPVAH